MTDTTGRDDGPDGPGTQEGAIDFKRIESSAEFRELVTRRKRFVTAASVVFFGEFILYLGLATFATGFMGTQIVDGLPVAWVAAMLQVVLTWAVTWAYLRQADRVFEPLERRAAEQVSARFVREDDPGAPATAPTATDGGTR